jgi:FkbM family methyltransferase
MLVYIQKLTNPKNLQNFLKFIWMIKNPFILPMSIWFPAKRVLKFKFNKQSVSLVYRNIYDLAIIFEIFVTTVYPLEFVQNSTIMADVGGHAGYTAIWSSIINPKLVIHSYEPEPENQKLFEQNISLNSAEERIILHKFGLGSKDETITFYKYENNADNSTILHVGREYKDKFDIVVKNSESELSSINPDYLKVDIEGYEDEAIYSYFQSGQKPKYMSIEFSDNPDRTSIEAIQKWLDARTEYNNVVDGIVVASQLKI